MGDSHNQWWSRVNYRPRYTGLSGTPPFSRGNSVDQPSHGLPAPGLAGEAAARVPSKSTNGNAAVKHPFHIRYPFLAVISTAIISSIASAVMTFFLTSHSPSPITIPVPELSDPNSPLMAVELERAPKESGLQYLISHKSPLSAAVVPRWNYESSHHLIFGSENNKKAFYLPIPRQGWEAQFGQLVRLGELKLYEIRVRADLLAKDLDNHLYKWAAHCGVSKPWIDHWSSWQSPSAHQPYGKLRVQSGLQFSGIGDLVNGCKPGGTCFVVAFDCDGEAIQDFMSLQNKAVE